MNTETGTDIERANALADLLGLPVYTVPNGAVCFNGRMYYFLTQAREFIDAAEVMTNAVD